MPEFYNNNFLSMKKNFPIIIVDDDEDDSMMMKEALREAGVANPVVLMSDGDMIISLLKMEVEKKESDYLASGMILLDLNMPKKDGREVLNFVRNNAQLKHMPIIIYTTSRSREDVKQAYSAGANSFISKPVSYDELLKVVRSIQNFWFHVVTLPT